MISTSRVQWLDRSTMIWYKSKTLNFRLIDVWVKIIDIILSVNTQLKTINLENLKEIYNLAQLRGLDTFKIKIKLCHLRGLIISTYKTLHKSQLIEKSSAIFLGLLILKNYNLVFVEKDRNKMIDYSGKINKSYTQIEGSYYIDQQFAG